MTRLRLELCVSCFHGGANFCALRIRPYATFPVRKLAPITVFAAVFCASQQFQIAESIVSSILVLMMNMLVWFQQTTNVLLHYQTVLKHISAKGIGMLRYSNANISGWVNKTSAACSFARAADDLSMFFGSRVDACWHDIPHRAGAAS